ncbi:MAG: glycoside hydrolase family 127 protein [Kiritimatiellales bacterium]|nr:glycoside hydrolase family 127 protein [Kiritimatiellales bacterium]MCF7864063.1 glycoside hydrolase family 127 protein [Kiritimatiellales bacterium]
MKRQLLYRFFASIPLVGLCAEEAVPVKPNYDVGPKGNPGFEAADIFHVDVDGELADRKALMMRDLLVWYPTTAGVRQTGRSGPLDFDKEILSLWTTRMRPEDVRSNPNTYTGLGKALLAMIHYAKDSGNLRWTSEKNRIVETILQSQESDGYLGNIQRPDPKNDPAGMVWRGWNLHDSSYLCLALVENHRLFGHEPSLEAARRYGDFIMAYWDAAPKQPGQLSPIGITDFFFALQKATGDGKYLDFIAGTPFDGRFIEMESLRDWRQELYPMRSKADADAGGNDDAYATAVTRKVHSYRYFARLIDQLKLYEAQGRKDSGLFAMSRYTLDKMADSDAPGIFISGANTRSEGWVEDQCGKGTVGEGCAVVHMVWWLSKLIEEDGDLSYGDCIERAICNHLEAAQDPNSGQMRYDVCLSGERNFRKGAHCCDGNHKRFWADIERLIYYTFPGGLAVSLYTPSTAKLEVDGIPVVLQQETAYPSGGTVTLAVDPAKAVGFALRLRIPRWTQSHVVAVNGNPVEASPVPGGIEITREWKPGDSVTLDLPMEFRWIAGMEFYAGYAALACGPQVYCLATSGNPGLSGIKNWSGITVDSTSVGLLPPPLRDGVRQPIEAKAHAWSPGRPLTEAPDLDLVFSDFPVADGFETYFRLDNPEAACGDELFEQADGKTPPAPVARGIERNKS